ncbi:hypothetical protein [Robiginitalea biformata]|uniref:Uncharacterized protein n=1 Tax=Robiginitalea biformata (strain ATCC BAA-864 / DSM 15991 / KCTC 12146 / HTCC2501) TaxID=313596 RepID=A4CIA1_ROBBH|nr:hypothetical protein [Robiginitalea biformata]EAR16659.1 hypothetical protein RB2501_07155 [Robiginitalea biformata HTCC2501]
MAYITTYTLSQLSKRLELHKDEVTEGVFLEHIYNDTRIYHYLNKYELRYLFNYSSILKDPITYLEQVPIQRDTRTYVQERDEKLKYHLYLECELLHKDFIGFKIPPEVKEEDLVEEFRNWFKENDFIEKYLADEITKAAIIYRYNSGFAPRYNLPKLNESYELIRELKNSGYFDIDGEFDLSKFYRDISQWVFRADNRLPIPTWKLLGKWHSFGRKSLNDIENLLERLQINHGFRNANPADVIRERLSEHHKEIIELIRMLREYFNWTYKAENVLFDVVTLENFNLKCCSNCRDLKELEVLNKSGAAGRQR